MRLSTNDKLIDRQSKIARYSTFGGLAVLFGALVISFNNTLPLGLAYVLLLAGFMLAYVGAILANKYVKEPRGDHALEKALKGFDNKNHLYNFLLPATHVLLTPTGLLVLKVKSQEGSISCSGENWRRPFALSRLVGGLGQEGLGNPAAELRDEIAKMKKWIADHVEGGATVPIDGYVVFSSDKVNLELNDPTVPVVQVDGLKETLRKAKRGTPMPSELYERLSQALDGQPDAKTA